MNDPLSSPAQAGEPSREETMTALFANLVLQQTNLALMFLGCVPHPETGKVVRDLETAQAFIDQLEMLEFKTKGNLDPRETRLMQESLTAVRMAFVEAADASESAPAKATEGAPPTSATVDGSTPPSDAGEEETRKKFSKKY